MRKANAANKARYKEVREENALLRTEISRLTDLLLERKILGRFKARRKPITSRASSADSAGSSDRDRSCSSKRTNGNHSFNPNVPKKQNLPKSPPFLLEAHCKGPYCRFTSADDGKP